MYKWQLNCSTGDYIHNADRLTRIIRMRGGGLYVAEFWGDYSFDYPISGAVAKSPQRALEELRKVMTAQEIAMLNSR